MRPYRVGLTGGLGSGKSTVADLLRERGFLVFDADRIVAELYEPGAPGVVLVRSLLGDAAVTAEGRVDRRFVAERVFADGDLRARLEAGIHPLVRQRFAAEAAGARPEDIVVLEATLLIEAGYRPDFDLVVTVEAEPELRLRRAVERGLTEAAANARLAAQGSGQRRLAGADLVLRNDGSLEELRTAVDEIVEAIRSRAAMAP